MVRKHKFVGEDGPETVPLQAPKRVAKHQLDTLSPEEIAEHPYVKPDEEA